MNLILLLLIVGGIIFFFYQKKNNATLSTTDKDRLTYFDKKYQKQLAYVNASFDRIQKLTELSFDLLNLHLVKFLIEEDPDRYDAISARHQAGTSNTDEYEEWVVESKNPKIVKLRQSKALMSECRSTFANIFQLWEKAINKHIKNQTEQGLEFYLDDMQGACIYFDSFHSGISKDKIIKENKSVELFKRLEDLNQKLGSIFEDSQKRFFED